MATDDTTRLTLKTELLQRIEALGLQQALFPANGESINEIIYQLENLNPIPNPLHPDSLPSLLGNWELIYASSGTVVTRQLASIPDLGETLKIKRVWQTLVAGDTQKICASNGAFLDLPVLGEWRLQADGVWTWDTPDRTANVTFNAFSLQATKPFNLENWSLPELKIPVWEFFRNQALWTTSYLDPEIRVGRGATGNLFVFRRRDRL